MAKLKPLGESEKPDIAGVIKRVDAQVGREILRLSDR